MRNIHTPLSTAVLRCLALALGAHPKTHAHATWRFQLSQLAAMDVDQSTIEAIGDWHIGSPKATTSERLFTVDHGIARKHSAYSAAEGDGKGPDQRTGAGWVRLIAQIRAEGLVSDQADSGAHAHSD
jgi:hypothetical protein